MMISRTSAPGYNPLGAIKLDHPESVDEAGRIADALIVSEGSNDPSWEEAARALLRAIILHVATWDDCCLRPDLVTVRRLLAEGKVELRRFAALNAEAGAPHPPMRCGSRR